MVACLALCYHEGGGYGGLFLSLGHGLWWLAGLLLSRSRGLWWLASCYPKGEIIVAG